MDAARPAGNYGPVNFCLFESFCEMIDELPVKAILRTAEVQRRVLEEALAYQRRVPVDDAGSIASFCDFLMAAARARRSPARRCHWSIARIIGRLSCGWWRRANCRTMRRTVRPQFFGSIVRALTSPV